MADCIMKTCLCNIYPLEPHFYIVKLGYAGVYLFFVFLLKHCGYSLEPPRQGGSYMYPAARWFLLVPGTHNLCLQQKYEKHKKNSTENFDFIQLGKNLYITWACFRFAWSETSEDVFL